MKRGLITFLVCSLFSVLGVSQTTISLGDINLQDIGGYVDIPNSVDISNCSSVTLEYSWGFSLDWDGFGNMESAGECGTCAGDPENPDAGDCVNCWDFTYGQFGFDGNPGPAVMYSGPDAAGSEFINFGCTGGASTLDINFRMQNWASDEANYVTNIIVTCYELDVSVDAVDPTCPGSSINLNGSAPGAASVEWTSSGGATIDNPNSPNTTASNVSDGETFVLTAYDASGCSAMAFVTVSAGEEPEHNPDVDITGCLSELQFIDLTGYSSEVGLGNFVEWYDGDPNFGGVALGSPTDISSLTFVYAVVTDPSGCTVTVAVPVGIENSVSFDAFSLNGCPDGFLSFNLDNFQDSINNPLVENYVVYGVDPAFGSLPLTSPADLSALTSIWIRGFDNRGCFSDVEVPIQKDSESTLSPEPFVQLCSGSCIDVQLNVSNDGSAIDYDVLTTYGWTKETRDTFVNKLKICFNSSDTSEVDNTLYVDSTYMSDTLIYLTYSNFADRSGCSASILNDTTAVQLLSRPTLDTTINRVIGCDDGSGTAQFILSDLYSMHGLDTMQDTLLFFSDTLITPYGSDTLVTSGDTLFAVVLRDNSCFSNLLPVVFEVLQNDDAGDLDFYCEASNGPACSYCIEEGETQQIVLRIGRTDGRIDSLEEFVVRQRGLESGMTINRSYNSFNANNLYSITIDESSEFTLQSVTKLGGCPDTTDLGDPIIVTLDVNPVFEEPVDFTGCGPYILPDLVSTEGPEPKYYTMSGGNGTELPAGNGIDNSTTIYAYAGTDNCFLEYPIDIAIEPAAALDAIDNITSCTDIVLDEITGIDIKSASYYTEAGGMGTEYMPGETISASVTLFAYANCGGAEQPFTITIDKPEYTVLDFAACDFLVLPEITGTNLKGDEVYKSQRNGMGNTYMAGDTIRIDDNVDSLFIYTSDAACNQDFPLGISFQFTGLAGDDVDSLVCGSRDIDLLGLLRNNTSRAFFEEARASGALSGNMFSTAGLAEGTYTIYHIVPNILPCLPDTAVINIELTDGPSAGRALTIFSCTREVNLMDYLDRTASLGGSFYDLDGNPILDDVLFINPEDEPVMVEYRVGGMDDCPEDRSIYTIDFADVPDARYVNKTNYCVGECNRFAIEYPIDGIRVDKVWLTISDGIDSYPIEIDIPTNGKYDLQICNYDDGIFDGTNLEPQNLYTLTIDSLFSPDTECTYEGLSTHVIRTNKYEGTYQEHFCQDTTFTIGDMTFGPSLTSGVATIVEGGQNGCDSTVVVDVSFGNRSFGETTYDACLGQDFIDPDFGETWTFEDNQREVVLTNGSVNGCDSVVMVTVKFADRVVAPYRDTICPDETLTILGTTFSPSFLSDTLNTGMQSVTGCDSLLSVEITIREEIVGEYRDQLCPESTATILGTEFSINMLEATLPSGMTDRYGCDSMVHVLFTLYDRDINDYTADAPFCENAVVDIEGGIFNKDNIGDTIRVGTSVNGCDSFVVNRISFTKPAASSTIDTKVCDSDFSLTVNGVTFDRTMSSGQVDFASGGVDVCDSTVYVNIVFNSFEQNVSVRSAGCGDGDQGQLVIESIDSPGNYTINVDGSEYAITALPYSIDLSIGSYNATISNGECSNPISFTIAAATTTDYTALVDTRYQISITPDTDIDSIRWDGPASLSCLDCIDPVANPTVDTTYTGVVFYGGGCQDTVQVAVKAPEPFKDYYIPNVFNPRGTNNNLFKVVPSTFADGVVSTMVIYDRWGNEMYSIKDGVSTGNPEGWDGTFNTKYVDEGVYVYRVVITEPDGDVIEKLGTLTVLY